MTTANQIASDTKADVLAAFLKFSTAGQFQLLNLEQVNILELAINEAYINHVPN